LKKTKSAETSVGIIAPSSKVPEVEFALGVERIWEGGLETFVHPHVLDTHLFFAGTDEVRAQAFYDYAFDPRFRVLWCARGGYGSARLLPILDKLTRAKGVPPRKLLAGFSDSTAILEYVRTRWGWSTLHAAMPGLRKFCLLPEVEWRPLIAMIHGKKAQPAWQKTRLQFFGEAPKKEISAPLVGGNLSVWASLVGTPYAGNARGKIVFFEDVDENLYRVDRMVQQLLHSDAFVGAKAIVLGNFLSCRDLVPLVLTKKPHAKEHRRMIENPKPGELEPLRKTMPQEEALAAIFSEVIRRHKIPVAYGLPVGHGPEKAPLPLGARYSLTPRGQLKLLKWDWK
jgi:muramoyltetrapeptide carboxypeptidase